MANARRAAHEILLRREKGRVDREAQGLLDLPADERPLAQDIVLGVRRNLFLLDAILRQFVRDKIGAVPLSLREALRMGVYELLFRDRIPAPVIVAETVGLAGRSPKERGFVNAVLRRISESFEITAGEGDILDRCLVWTGPGRVARFGVPVLPDPGRNQAKHLSTLFTLTEPFTTAVMRLLPIEHVELFRALNVRLPLSLRPSRKSGGPAALCERLQREGCLVLARRGSVIEVQTEGPPAELPVLKEGLAAVQDATAAEVAPLLDPHPGERVLDLCAPPGGKTAHLAELMGDQGEVVACHQGPEKAAPIQENASRLGLSCIRLHDLGEDGKDLPSGPFDRILVDAPCSNSGVFMKRVDARFRAHPKEWERLEDLQFRLLKRATPLLRTDGWLVYATCSVLLGENHALVRRFLAVNREFELIEERLRYPHRTLRDGGYMALFTRR